ncbi:exonuclease mut-7 homolog, partial [Paramuricea clavata]
MLNLVHIASWISEIFTTNSQEDGKAVDESEFHIAESANFEHVPTTNMVDSMYESPHDSHKPSVSNDLMLDCLRISDSEDWDTEIDSMSSTATYSSEPLCEYNMVTHTQITGSTVNTAHSEIKQNVNVHRGFSSQNSPSSPQKQYFDDEIFAKALPQRKSELQLNEGNYISDQNSRQYKQREVGYNSAQVKSKHHSQHGKQSYDPVSNPNTSLSHHFPSDEQDCADGYIWSETSSKSDESTIQPNIVKDILTNFQDSIPHDISSEPSMPNSDQAFDYENMFQWDYMERLTHLEAVFTQEDKPTFLDKLKQTLNCTPPYSFLLYLVENHYANMLEGKKSLAHVALTQFDKWRSEGLFAEVAPTEMEKDRALWIVTTRKLYLFDLCNKIFDLDSKGNEYLQRHIYYLLQSKKRYKEAVTIACKLNLQPCFQPMEILFPLVILNKVQLAESYIANCPWQQRAFVSMLDKLCVMSDEQLDELTSEIIPAKPSSNKVTQASLTKLGERIVKKFNLNPDDFPELFKAKNVKGLSYLLHQRQKDKGRSSKKWDDLIERCVGNSTVLQQSLVDLLTEFGDKEEAKRWERFYLLSSERDQELSKPNDESNEEDWENEIKENETVFSDYAGRKQDHKKSVFPEKPLEERYRTSVKYLTLQIPMQNIYFVDDTESLRSCQRALSKHGVTIGFDAEWKPQMCQAGLAQRLSIVQLSLRDRVFILDIIALAEQVPEGLILAFGNAVFANENVLKLGYGVESDFKALITTLPILERSIKKMKRFVDLCTLSQQLFEIPVIKIKVDKTTQSLTSFGHLSEKGLSLLVQQCLGLPLDKTYQLSDWEQRPLLTKQVEYAALDARCLIDVFEVLKKWMIEGNIVVDLNECSPRLPWLFPKRS